MPFIQIKVFEGALTSEDKNEMIKRVSEVVAEIESRPNPTETLLPHVWVQIDEMPVENFGVGGLQMTEELVGFLLKK